MHKHTFPPLRLAWTVWGLGAALYLFGFFQRVAPGVITSELSTDFGLSAAALGSLSAFYFYSYVAMQIPTGILADVWGPRRLLTVGAILSAVGTLIFAFSGDVALAKVGRLLIGGSVAVAFVCMLKLANHWLAPKNFALASGMALLMGITGAVAAGVPLHLLVDSYGWRHVMAVSAIFPVVVALGIWLIVRNDPSEKGYKSYTTHEPAPDAKPWAHALKGLIQVFKYRNTWLLAFVPAGIVGSILTFAGLWGVPFLTTHHGLSKSDAAAVCSALLIVWAIASPLCGALSDRLGHRKPLYIIGCAVTAACWVIILFMPAMPVSILIGLLLTIGVASAGMTIGFAFGKESVPNHLAGTVSGVINMGVMMGPMILQPAVGWMLDKNWSGEVTNGVKVYSLSAYQNGFALMVLWAVASFVVILFTVEKRSKPL